MSEDRRLQDLREKITDVSRNERNGLSIIAMGVFLVSAGLIISVLGNSHVASIAGFLAIVLGLISTVFGFYVTAHCARQYNHLLQEIEQTRL